MNDNEKKVVEAMKGVSAIGEGSGKTSDQIAFKCPLPKGLINNLLTQLASKGVVKRVAKSKAGVYYLVQQ